MPVQQTKATPLKRWRWFAGLRRTIRSAARHSPLQRLGHLWGMGIQHTHAQIMRAA